MKPSMSREIRERVDQLEIPFNAYGLDRYGISKKHLHRFMMMLGFFYKHWLTVDVEGIENVPKRGRAMLVGNHSGGVALDGGMIIASMMFAMDPPRLAHAMADKFLIRTPVASTYLSRVGQFTGLPEHVTRLLEDERLLVVFPEGHLGTAKLYWERHSLVKFGTGFLRLALKTNTPIIPVAFVGGGEAIPTFHNSKLLGALSGAPYVPLTPWGVPLPKPTRCQIHYGEAMTFDGDGTEEDEVIEEWVGQIKGRIAGLLEDGVARRPDYAKGRTS